MQSAHMPHTCQSVHAFCHLLPSNSCQCCRLHSLQEKRGYVVETREQQQGAFLHVMRCFVQVLSSGHGTAVGDAMDTGGVACWVGVQLGVPMLCWLILVLRA